MLSFCTLQIQCMLLSADVFHLAASVASHYHQISRDQSYLHMSISQNRNFKGTAPLAWLESVALLGSTTITLYCHSGVPPCIVALCTKPSCVRVQMFVQLLEMIRYVRTGGDV